MKKRNNSHAPFDATAELHKTRAYIKVRRRKGRYYRSQLDVYRNELIGMRKIGGSFRELKVWLENEYGISCHPTTIMRYLSKLPKTGNQNG